MTVAPFDTLRYSGCGCHNRVSVVTNPWPADHPAPPEFAVNVLPGSRYPGLPLPGAGGPAPRSNLVPAGVGHFLAAAHPVDPDFAGLGSVAAVGLADPGSVPDPVAVDLDFAGPDSVDPDFADPVAVDLDFAVDPDFVDPDFVDPDSAVGPDFADPGSAPRSVAAALAAARPVPGCAWLPCPQDSSVTPLYKPQPLVQDSEP